MTTSRHHQIESLFLEAVELPLDRRSALLDERCAEDGTLRAEVEALLEVDARTGGATAQPFVSVAVEAPPASLGPYRLGEKLGEGGFGEVYAAEQTTPIRRSVAIKMLRAGLDSQAVLARFEAERHALALMDHPGIARVFDAGVSDSGRPYFVMERVSGEPITAYCDHHRLAARPRIELMIAVCRAVEHAHQKGVIHRDLKPSNLLVTTSDGAPLVRVIDFGIAKATRTPFAEGAHTRVGEFLGTPEYASPEHVESGGADVDTRTDVYSLGVVLFRLLTGRLPFDSDRLRAGGLVEMARVLRDTDPPRPSSVAARADVEAPVAARALRGDLDWIVLRALARERDRRYASAAALGDDLARHLRDEPVEAGPPSAGYRLGKLARRHRALVVGAAAVLVVLLAGLATTAWQAARATRAERRARQESHTARAVNEFLTRMIAGANPERSPGGDRVTVKEMVDRAARELDAVGAGAPDVEAGVRHAIGSTYMGLSLYSPAEEQLTRAVALRERLDREGRGDPRGTLDSRLALADLNLRVGRYAQADSMLLAVAQAPELATDRALHVRWLQLRGGALANLSRNPEADSAYVAAIALSRGASELASSSLVTSLAELAGVRASLGKQDEAVALAKEALDLTRREHSGDHHDVADAAARLGEILHQGGAYAAAESLHREALAIDRRVLGERHAMIATRLSNLAWVLADAGRLPEAEAAHREAIALHVTALGEDHPTVAIARGHLATVLQGRGALNEALALRREVLAANRRHFGNDHEEVANALNNLGSVYRLMRRHDEATAAFREAIPIFERLYGPAHPTLAVTRHNLGKTLGEAGRNVEAETELRAALDLASRVFPDGHINVRVFEATYGRTLRDLGRYAEAEQTLLAAREAIVATLGAEHPRSREVTSDLATLYQRWGRPADAERWRKVAAGT